MIVAFLNYLFHPLIGRLLSVTEFGEVQTVIALATEVTMAFTAFTVATVHATTNCVDLQECAAIVSVFKKGALALVAIIFLLVLVSVELLANVFQFSSVYPFIALAILLVTTALFMIRQGVLQGRSRFLAVSIGNLLVAGGRVLFALVLIWLGWRAAGAIGGLVMAQLVGLLYVFVQTRQTLDAPKHDAFVVTRIRFWREMRYMGLAFFTTAYVTVLYTADVLVVKSYFSPEIAGMYSGISTVAKIIFFASSPIAGVLLPSVKLLSTFEENRRVFVKAAGMVCLIGGSVLGAFVVVPRFIVALLMGDRYLDLVALLPWMACAFFVVSLLNLLTNFGLALRRQSLILLVVVGGVLLAFLTALHHASPLAIVQNFFGVAVISLIGAVMTCWKDIRRGVSSALAS